MSKGKRSVVNSSRLTELKAKNSVYVITCGTGCVCGGKDERCGRGFFSLFIQAVYGIDFARRWGLEYHIDFGNRPYCYTDVELERNFWNYYFLQPQPHLRQEDSPVINQFNELYPLRIWDREHLREVHNEIVSQLTFQEPIRQLLEKAVAPFTKHKVLGLHIRGTDHEWPPVPMKEYMKTIDRQIKSYDRLFVSTDDGNALNLLKSRYGDVLFSNDVTRSFDDKPVHGDVTSGKGYQLGMEVLMDCYCLSKCNKAILTNSNISYAALLFNPTLPYILLERLQAKQKRFKTLTVYLLNKWGIRKW